MENPGLSVPLRLLQPLRPKFPRTRSPKIRRQGPQHENHEMDAFGRIRRAYSELRYLKNVMFVFRSSIYGDKRMIYVIKCSVWKLSTKKIRQAEKDRATCRGKRKAMPLPLSWCPGWHVIPTYMSQPSRASILVPHHQGAWTNSSSTSSEVASGSDYQWMDVGHSWCFDVLCEIVQPSEYPSYLTAIPCYTHCIPLLSTLYFWFSTINQSQHVTYSCSTFFGFNLDPFNQCILPK